MPALIYEGGSLRSAYASEADLFQKHPHRNTPESVSPALWASFSPVQLTHKINNHRRLKDLELSGQRCQLKDVLLHGVPWARIERWGGVPASHSISASNQFQILYNLSEGPLPCSTKLGIY